MLKSEEGSTRRLLELCLGYFVFYVITGITVKYFTQFRTPKMSDIAYLFNNTLGGSFICLAVVVALGWTKLKSNRLAQWGPFRFPSEFLYIIPSGVCTAIVIPTTTLLYTLPITVMVAMVIMRGSIIVISRVVDAIQIRQGILKKRVYAEENWGIVFALLAVGTVVFLIPIVNFLEARDIPAARFFGLSESARKSGFDFMRSSAALTIMGLYVLAYMFRIYIMNYYKNTRGVGVKLDNQGFFAIEQIAASGTMILGGIFFFSSPELLGWSDSRILDFKNAALHPEPWSILSGLAYGMVAFFSVFIFMFKGRTATFAGLVNRLTSLLAGTTSTLLVWLFFHAAFPKLAKLPTAQDWLSLVFILIAVGFLTRAEKLRAAELKVTSRVAEPVMPSGAVARETAG
jgi:hypothetical protein